LEVPVRVVTVGEEAARHAPSLLEALAEAGGRAGLGEGRVTFELGARHDRPPVEGVLRAEDLPTTPDALRGRLPRVGVGLVAPLFLTRRGPCGREPVLRPEFADLLRSALRGIGELFHLYGEPLEADFRALKEAAESVPLLEHCYELFAQPKWSSRGGQRYQLRGVVGGAVYSNVPLSLLPWLLWGGRFHVGGHRVAGAGGWRFVLD
jgi:hypothetical protein